ncbi:fibronectin type III domain-containing protein [Catellatospora tritici]|uniref:fibronectin type III domain-containing protein n=1 Tax=Catellatospora tritici TaxID=2851566 RepID=UPI001C2DE23B|nr:fibronectin type III domain-containing protein [Catellatospora tritici]MBV1856016.1 fibronectin type III domain-containing protein [Catellatospora tritici]
MGQPHPGSAQQARKLVLELGRMLSDITSGRDVAAVHQRLLDQFDAADHDSRIDAVEVGRREFTQTWTALRQGLALPAEAWEQVVLPAIVAFSDPVHGKTNLELATSCWLAARAAVDAVPDFPTASAELAALEVGAAESASVRSMMTTTVRTPIVESTRAAAPTAESVPTPRPRRRRTLLAVVAVSVTAAAVVVLLLVNGSGGGDGHTGVPAGMPMPALSAGVVAASSGAPTVQLPTAPPTASPQPMPMITGEPTPEPVWSPSAPASAAPGAPSPAAPVPPSAPTNLTAVAADEHTIWLAWSAPADGGTGGVSYYRILRDGQFVGWTRATSVTIDGLAPGTSYTFAIVACNAAGLQSGLSNQITAMTASPPVPSPSPAAPSPIEPTSAEPSPPPSPSEEPPTPSESASPTTEPSPLEAPEDPEGDGAA